jgi:hypothetical protein
MLLFLSLSLSLFFSLIAFIPYSRILFFPLSDFFTLSSTGEGKRKRQGDPANM